MSKHKSAIGSRPNVSEPPPHANGKPWWTTPPISAPDPRYLVFAQEFKQELQRKLTTVKGGRDYNDICALLGSVKRWIKVANVLAQEFENERVGLGTTDGLIIESHRLVRSLLYRLGGFNTLTSESERAVANALQLKADSLLQQRSGRAAAVRPAGSIRRGGR